MGQVLFAFTLVRREGVRNEFWGQAFVEGTSVLDKRGKVRLNFGDLKVRRRACSTPARLVRHGTTQPVMHAVSRAGQAAHGRMAVISMLLVLHGEALAAIGGCGGRSVGSGVSLMRLACPCSQFEPRDRKNIVPLKTRVLDEEVWS